MREIGIGRATTVGPSGCLRCTRFGAVALLVILISAMVGGASTPASADVSEAVEALLGNLQVTPLMGDPPPFTLESLTGGRRSLADLKGQVVLLYFWATW